MLDYAIPATFPPSTKAKGMGPYTHRGYETVTIVFDGELTHKDSAGNSGQFGRLD
jgi:quercetin 2,3-dioxygenase